MSTYKLLTGRRIEILLNWTINFPIFGQTTLVALLSQKQNSWMFIQIWFCSISILFFPGAQ